MLLSFGGLLACGVCRVSGVGNWGRARGAMSNCVSCGENSKEWNEAKLSEIVWKFAHLRTWCIEMKRVFAG